METSTSFIEPLLERAEAYSKTSFELLKLKTVDKTADIISSLMIRLLLAIVVSLFVIVLNIGVALWLGELLGKNYYGFLIVAAFYGILAIVIQLIHPKAKERINNAMIKQLLK